MNADLEKTLDELGPQYRMVVGRLRSAQEVSPRTAIRLRKLRGFYHWPLVAALLPFVAVGLALLVTDMTSVQRPLPSTPSPIRPAPSEVYGAHEYRMTTDEMIATQQADGGWVNDFLTRRNAAALKDLDDPRAQVAYKRAMRNLRLRQAL